MIKVRQFLTEGTSIDTDAIVSLYIPGVAISIWFYVFALGDVFSTFVIKFGIESRPLYLGLLAAIIMSSIISGWIIDKTEKSLIFTYFGLGLCGAVSMLSFGITSSNQLSLYTMLVGSVVGVGITGLRVYLADLTEIEERGRVAGGLLLTVYVSVTIWEFLLKDLSTTLSILTLSLLCFGASAVYFFRPKKISAKKKVGAYGRTLHYLLISWLLFAGAYGIWNAFVMSHPISLISDMNNAVFGVLIKLGYGLAAIVGGISIDWVGRRAVAGLAFATLAIAYMIYGLMPFFSYIALFLEVVSWGFLSTVFLFVVWGDVSKNQRGLFYGLALGMFFGGFLLGESLAQVFAPMPWNYLSILSGALLILAIVPLYYSDEPLPKEKVKLREMASYMKEIKNLKI